MTMKKKVLVTGSNGYIGRHVVDSLLKQGHEVVAVDINNDALDKDRENLTTFDCSLFDNLTGNFERFGKPDVCIHLAWRNGFSHNADSHIGDLSTHYLFLKNLVDEGIKSVACMGTMHEVGYFEGAIDENSPCNPLSQYGIAKNALRQALIQYVGTKEDVKLFWLRAYYILGDDMKNHSIFSKILQMEENGQKTFPFTSGKNLYDFIDVNELAFQIALASTQDEVDGIINVCTGNPVSLGDKVNEFIEKHGLNIRPEYGAFPDRPYDSPGVWGNADKINLIKANAERNK